MIHQTRTIEHEQVNDRMSDRTERGNEIMRKFYERGIWQQRFYEYYQNRYGKWEMPTKEY